MNMRARTGGFEMARVLAHPSRRPPRAVAAKAGEIETWRMLVRRAALVWGLSLWAGTALAVDLLEEIAANLDAAPAIVAEFTQTRRIAALTRPVVAHGRVVFLRGQGVAWQIERPFRHAYVFAQGQVTEINASGERIARDTRAAPGSAQAGQVFAALLRGDLRYLHEHFDISTAGQRDAWRAELKPREAAWSQVMPKMGLEGGNQVTRIELAEASGDTTVIRLRQIYAGDRLDAAHTGYFQ